MGGFVVSKNGYAELEERLEARNARPSDLRPRTSLFAQEPTYPKRLLASGEEHQTPAQKDLDAILLVIILVV